MSRIQTILNQSTMDLRFNDGDFAECLSDPIPAVILGKFGSFFESAVAIAAFFHQVFLGPSTLGAMVAETGSGLPAGEQTLERR